MQKPVNAHNAHWLDPFRRFAELSAADYGGGFAPVLPRRTALNRLGKLQAAGWVVRSGQTRASIYRLTDAGKLRVDSMVPGGGDSNRPEVPGEVRSATDEQVIRHLRQPVHQRRPVGYRQEFLEAYQPNQSYYLAADDRRKLLEADGQPGLVDELAGTYTRHICQRLLIDLSWNSSRLEGNTYSILETEQLFQSARSGESALANEAVMILNHKAAIEFLLESAPVAGFDRHTILNLHALLTADLLGDPGAEGALRTAPVGIGKSAYLPMAIPALIESQFDRVLAKAAAIRDPFEQAFFVMVHLPYLQPFIDGNKQVSRLAANIPLFHRHLAPLSFVDVAETEYTDAILAVYELNDISLLRTVFIQAYERSAQRYTVIRGAIGDPDPFRVQYRGAIVAMVGEIIRAGCNRADAVARLRAHAGGSVVEGDRLKLVAAVEETLAGIHEGNFARYRVRPAEFEAWKVLWQA